LRQCDSYITIRTAQIKSHELTLFKSQESTENNTLNDRMENKQTPKSWAYVNKDYPQRKVLQRATA